MYSPKVMEHFANPHNVGELPDANGVGEVGNQKCGDIMKIYIKVENNIIVDVKFLTFYDKTSYHYKKDGDSLFYHKTSSGSI